MQLVTIPQTQTQQQQAQSTAQTATAAAALPTVTTAGGATILTPQLTGMPGNVSISVGSPASAAALVPQLTGSLTLAVSEHCERLILRHDPNNPQDHQSQLILQALLKGALPNVTIINEPTRVDSSNKTPAPTPPPTQTLPAPPQQQQHLQTTATAQLLPKVTTSKAEIKGKKWD